MEERDDIVLPPAAIAAIERGAKLEAIREARAATGLGLYEASRLIANHIAARPALKMQFEERYAASRRRLIMWVIVIDLLVAAAVIWWLIGR